MTDQITLKEALKLVEFEFIEGAWRVKHVKGSVYGEVKGSVYGEVWCNVRSNLRGDLYGNACGDVCGDVWGNVWGTINGRKWQFIETPKAKLKRLMKRALARHNYLKQLINWRTTDE